MIRRACLSFLCAVWGLSSAGCDRPPGVVQPSATTGTTISQVVFAGDAEQPIGVVRLAVDRSKLTVADRVRLTIVTATRSEIAPVQIHFEPELPQPPSGRLGDMVVVSSLERAVTDASGLPGVERTLVLEPFLDGSKTVPGIRVRFETANAGNLEVSTEPVTLEVSSVLAESEQKAEIVELASAAELAPLSVPPPVASGHSRLIIGGAGIALLLACGAIAYLASRRRVPATDPKVHALSQLARQRTIIASAIAEPFGAASSELPGVATQIGSIARQFVQAVTSMPAIGATVAELDGLLTVKGLSAASSEPITSLLDALRSLEKEAFAPGQPRAGVLNDQLSAIERFIREFTPAVDAPSDLSATLDDARRAA